MSERDARLIRQLERAFGAADAEARLAELREWAEGRAAELPDGIRSAAALLARVPDFLDQVESAYAHARVRDDLAYRALEVSSREMSATNDNLALMNQSINALVNSLGQGFFVFDRFGMCLPFYSKACEDLIEGIPVGRHLGDVLRVPEHERYYFDGWVTLLFEGVMEFEEMADLGPKTFMHSTGRYITLEFKPIRAASPDAQGLEGVVVIATDRTGEREAQRRAQEQQEFSDMILKLTKERNQLFNFVQETRRMIWLVSKYSQTFTEGDGLKEVRRLLHTIKGAAAAFYIKRIRDCAHTFESEIATLEGGTETLPPDEVARKLEYYAKRLEAELNRFLSEQRELLGPHFEKHGHTRAVSLRELYAFAAELSQFPAGEILRRRFLESVVAVPLSTLFLPFDSTVQQLAGVMDKRIDPLVFRGEDPRVLQELYQDLFNALIHVFRNHAVHGIESQKDRAAQGKGAGQIIVSAKLERARSTDWIEITIEDDGRGIDPNAIRNKLKSLGRFGGLENETDEQIIQHIFDEGFSTSEVVNEMAGRGVGLNVVREAVQRLKGTMEVRTEFGKGTKFVLRVPHVWTGLENFVN